MWGIPYDDLDGWRGPYPPEVFAAQFEKMAKGWQPGIAELQLAVEKTPPDRRNEVQAGLRASLEPRRSFSNPSRIKPILSLPGMPWPMLHHTVRRRARPLAG